MLFVLASFSMNAFSEIVKNEVTDCKDYAIRAGLAEQAYYGYTNFYDTFQAVLAYREMCEESDGNVTDPVFL